MPWFRLDDSFHSHPKVIAVGNEAVGLYVRCGTYAAQHLTDGLVPEHVVLLYGSRELADTLVRAKLWRRTRGGWQIHDYLAYNPSKEQVQRDRKSNARRQALFRDPDIKKSVRDRDGSNCRYCGQIVRWGKGQAPDSGTYDHVDPQGSNTLVNLVVACLSCNARKKDRTPEQAGMVLRPVPDDASVEASREPSREALPTRPDPTTPQPPEPDGSGGQPAGPEHHGQHKHCRACGTTQRGKPPPPPAERHPSARTLAEAVGNGHHPADEHTIAAIAAQTRAAITRDSP